MPFGFDGKGAVMPGSPPRRCLILLTRRCLSRMAERTWSRSSPESPFAFGLIDPRQQASGVKHKALVRALLGLEAPLLQPFVGPTPHALRPRRKWRIHSGVAAEPFP